MFLIDFVWSEAVIAEVFLLHDTFSRATEITLADVERRQVLEFAEFRYASTRNLCHADVAQSRKIARP